MNGRPNATPKHTWQDAGRDGSGFTIMACTKCGIGPYRYKRITRGGLGPCKVAKK